MCSPSISTAHTCRLIRRSSPARVQVPSTHLGTARVTCPTRARSQGPADDRSLDSLSRTSGQALHAGSGSMVRMTPSQGSSLLRARDDPPRGCCSRFDTPPGWWSPYRKSLCGHTIQGRSEGFDEFHANTTYPASATALGRHRPRAMVHVGKCPTGESCSWHPMRLKSATTIPSSDLIDCFGLSKRPDMLSACSGKAVQSDKGVLLRICVSSAQTRLSVDQTFDWFLFVWPLKTRPKLHKRGPCRRRRNITMTAWT